MVEFYTINLDKNNYVLSIAHTSRDNIEIDLSNIDLSYLNAYQYLNGELILNETKKAELIEEEKKRQEEAKKPTQMETIEAQVMYTALMTDTMLEE